MKQDDRIDVFAVIKAQYNTKDVTNEGKIYHTVDIHGNFISETWIAHDRFRDHDLGIKPISNKWLNSFRGNRQLLDNKFGPNKWRLHVISSVYDAGSLGMSAPAINAVQARPVGQQTTTFGGNAKGAKIIQRHNQSAA